MAWLKFVFAFLMVFAASIGTSFLSIAWKRRRKIDKDASAIESRLPGHDCSFCGFDSCRDYAIALGAGGVDPALCAPGGAEAEESIRRLLAERRDDPRSISMRAIVRCGGTNGSARLAFDYDGREDCASAAALYGGPRLCKDGCLGFGSCAEACPLSAIRIQDGLAAIDGGLCTGCGACVDACPKGLVSLVPADAPWFVACASRLERTERRAVCSAACDACGECVRHSMHSEFAIADGIAHASSAHGGAWAEIAPLCPSKAIRSVEGKKRSNPPFGRSDAKL
jgi:Na+-translocating ferredoxin:NAD+ oxidoreductase RNF subunit RnfB